MEAFINEMVEPRVLDLIVLILPKWKLLIYIFLMNVIIFSPIYFFSVILINGGELQLICPSVILFGFNLIHRALFVRYNFNNTRSILLGVIILSTGISTSGVVAIYNEDGGSYLPVVLLYGLVGGYGYHLVFSKMWKVLAKIFNAKKEMFVIKFLHSFGQSIAPLFLLTTFYCPWNDYIYGSLLVLFGGILLNLIPITILIANEKNFMKQDQDSFIKITEKGNESFYNDVARNYTDAELNTSQSSDRESEPLSIMSWKNPANYSMEDSLPDPPVDLESDYDEDLINRDGKYFNSEGVEILDIIIEEDEENLECNEVAPEITSGEKRNDKNQWVLFSNLFKSVRNLYRNIYLRQHFNTRIVKSVRFALFEFKFYSCMLLKSTDLCVFVLFLTLLPRFVSYHYYYRGKSRQLLLMSFVIISSAWAMGSLLLLWCEIKFRKQQDKLLIFSILFKTFGYFCVYSTRSCFWTVFGCFLIGIGHAITSAYQDLVIKRKFTSRQWSLIKGALCLTSGLLVIMIGSLTNVAYVYCRVENVLLCVLLINCFSGSIWVVCNFNIIFR
ncbi:uncharacterized protein LOC131425870 [Malaya genurostris]|uniref:uncharacterized protein LOC131425870 n=1 Tax=Malaya genurostris TaxID=325434 RepID=UPI0026F3DAE0|nr:uncharacterized protein LOC131425870 [Malaya genurostris]